VHDGGSARPIHKIDVKALAGRERDARVSVRARRGRRLAAALPLTGEGPGAGSQAKLGVAGFGRGSSPLFFVRKGIVPAMANAGRKDLPAG